MPKTVASQTDNESWDYNGTLVLAIALSAKSWVLAAQVPGLLRTKAFWSAAITIAGIEIMHMIRKGQLQSTGKLRSAQQFYSLAG